MTPMKPAPKPHDPRTPSISVDDVRGRYEQALHAEVEPAEGDATEHDELALELAQFEAAYGVLSSALQDGE
ncbi:hypothetical protein QYQ98_00860 [Corynebacterium sp. P3-F1]|uniref:hypothetical protein n=1 Tax=Corynebacterium sp. P3-F1 TaxID=3059080 RepID=UPI00265D1398|nr:hypothetical protein [Corynebacterium sp. P3-F1]WKK61491.1 hypothetical protein QYQ98_00860 [Corynebacterium sp. P3-F1]